MTVTIPEWAVYFFGTTILIVLLILAMIGLIGVVTFIRRS